MKISMICTLASIIRVIKSRKGNWAGLVAYKGEKRKYILEKWANLKDETVCET